MPASWICWVTLATPCMQNRTVWPITMTPCLSAPGALGDLPEHARCRDLSAMARVHKDEAKQVCQKILRCLDMRVMDGDLVVPTCLRTPMLILPAGRFIQLYYNPDAQDQYTSNFPTGGQGFLQPRGDIRTSIIPRNFRVPR